MSEQKTDFPNMEPELKQVFNKVDKILRDYKLKQDFLFLQKHENLSAQNAILKLSDQTFTTWDGQKYRLQEKTIQTILYMKCRAGFLSRGEK